MRRLIKGRLPWDLRPGLRLDAEPLRELHEAVRDAVSLCPAGAIRFGIGGG